MKAEFLWWIEMVDGWHSKIMIMPNTPLDKVKILVVPGLR